MRKLYFLLFTLLFFFAATKETFAQYCTVTFPAANVEPITLVKFNTINNVTSAATSQPAYEDFTAISTTVLKEQSYTMTVEGNTAGDFLTFIDVYIDWNQDQDFDDVGEHFFIGTIENSTGTDGIQAIADIEIPAGATTGTTRMRVIKKFSSSALPCNTTSYGQAEDYTLTVADAPACIAPPGGGTIQGPSGNVCPNVPFPLTISGATFGSGLTYQWQSSPDGTTWTDISGANAKAYTATQTAATYYRRVTTCSGQSVPSTSLLVGINAVADCYCETGSEDADFEYIGNVMITGGVNNNTDNTTYSNYVTTNVATVFQGQQVKVTIEKGVSDWYSTDIAYVFADFNQDGDFNDPGELVGSKGGATSPYVISFVVPPTATLGNTRLRIKFGDTFFFFDINTDDPCQTSYSYGETEDYGLLITVPPSCVPPSGLVALPASPSQELLSWNASSTNPSGGYIWEIRSFGDGGSGAAGLEATGTTAAGVTTATATGLTGGTTYFAWVRADCGGGDLSMWEGPVQFTTVCDPTTIPFFQNFDAAVEPDLPPCVIIQDQNEATSWKMWYGGSPAASSDPASIRYEWNADTPADDWFFLQGMTLTAGKTYTLSFKYKASDGPAYIENLEVKYGASPNVAGMTAGTLFTQTGIESNIDSPFETASVSFTPSATGVYYLGFHAFSDADMAFLYIDDIAVESCATPAEVKAYSTTPTTADVYFTSAGSNFVIEYGPVGFAPGIGATAGTGTVITGVTSPVSITGLTADTEYDIYVRQSCDGGSEFSLNAMTTVRTLCDATTVPYLIDFEDANTPDVPGCTSTFDANGNSGTFWNDGTGGQWEVFDSQFGDPTFISGSKSLLYVYDPVNTNRPADDWFYTRGLNLTAGQSYRLKFYYKGAFGPDFFEKLEVKYGTIASPAGMSTGTLFTDDNILTNLDSDFDSVRVDFTPTSSGVYYLGFHAFSEADQGIIILEDISVRVTPIVDAGIPSIKETLPTCPTPNFVMTAKVVNYNLTPLNLATYPITVTASITGAATTTLTTNVSTGTIAPGDTLQVPLPAFTFNAGLHNIVFKVTNPNDSENANDAYSTSVYVNPTPIAAVFTPANPQSCALITTQFATAPPTPVELPAVSSGAISVAVPDNTPAGITNSLTVAGVPPGAVVTGIKVTLNMTHTYISDMIINLKAPNGKILNLFNGKGGSGDNLVNTVISSASTTAIPNAGAPFTNTYRPDGANGVGPTGLLSNVSTFADLYSIGNGDWTLGLRDVFSGDLGVLTSWSITITYGFPHPAVTWLPVTGLFTDAAGTIPYVAGTSAYSVYANPASETTYTVTSTAAGCTNSSTVTVKPLAVIANWPTKICISDELVALTASPVGGIWSGIGVSGNNFIPGATAVGTYPLTYRYTNASGCTASTTITAKVEDCPERIRLLRDDAVILFPNPNNGLFNIRINSVLYNNLIMRVYTNSGLLVQNRKLTGLAYGRVVPIDLTSLPSGAYMVQFYYEGGARTSDKTFPVIIGK